MGALDGKVVVVTGSSRGLGEAMAVGYAREGAHLVLAARSEDDLARVAEACTATAASVTVVPTDVTDEPQVEKLVEQALAVTGSIDVFVANAGISYAALTEKKYREIWSYDVDVVKGIFDVNVFGLLACLRAALPKMTAGSRFIAIGSETGRALYPGAGAYAVSKSAVDAIATLAAREAAQNGITVNVLSPGGMVDTKLFGPTGMPDWLKQTFPPLPEDVIVPAAIWLASDDAREVAGQLVNGKEFNAAPDDVKARLIEASRDAAEVARARAEAHAARAGGGRPGS